MYVCTLSCPVACRRKGIPSLAVERERECEQGERQQTQHLPRGASAADLLKRKP